MIFRFLLALLATFAIAAPAQADRIKDLGGFQGIRSNQLTGYGVVVGLPGTGDDNLEYTVQSMKGVASRFGLQLPQGVAPGLKNAAVVMITAELPPFAKPGQKLDITVFILYLIPGMPKDIFTFFVPLTEMRFRRFLVLSLVGRTPALICSTFGGAAFVQGNYLQMILLFAICGGLALLGIVFQDRIFAFVNKLRHKGEAAPQDEGSEATTDTQGRAEGDDSL